MAIWYKKGAGNWSAANGWNSLANGTGTDATATDSGGGIYVVGNVADTCDLNSLAVTLDVNVTQALIQSGNSAGYLTVSGTRTINSPVTYTTAGTSGMVRIGTGAAATINGRVSNTANGYAVVTSGSGTVAVSNVGAIALSNSGTGRALSHGSSGSFTISGDVTASTNAALYINSASATGTVTGAVSATGNGATGVYVNTATSVTVNGDVSASSANSDSYGVYCVNGTVTVNGNMSDTGCGRALYVAGGTATWTGSRTLSGDCHVVVESSATLALANGIGALALSCTGSFVLDRRGGTVTTTAAGGTAAITLASADGQAVGTGRGAAPTYSLTINPYGGGGTFPAEAYVHSDAGTYGPTGAEYTPALSALTNWVLKSAVVGAAYVLEGHDNYTGGSAGTYHEALTSEVKNGVGFGASSALTGTYSPGGTYADGQTAQLATDTAAVDAAKAGITTATTILGVQGTFDAGTYPAEEYVHTDAGTYGPNGDDYTPGLTGLANWLEITGETPAPSADDSSGAWWFDLVNGGFWIDSYAESQGQSAAYSYSGSIGSEQALLLGSVTGYVYRMSEAAPTDDAVTINSSVMLGPIALGAPGNEGVLTEIAAILDASSGDVAWAIHTGDSPEAAVASTTPAATGVWSAGANHSQYPRARGVAATIRLSATGPWAIESIDMTRLAGGKAR